MTSVAVIVFGGGSKRYYNRLEEVLDTTIHILIAWKG